MLHNLCAFKKNSFSFIRATHDVDLGDIAAFVKDEAEVDIATHDVDLEDIAAHSVAIIWHDGSPEWVLERGDVLVDIHNTIQCYGSDEFDAAFAEV